MRYLKFVLPAFLLALSTSVNAVVVNTLGGQQYEWLELTQTQGMSRNQVEVLLNDSTSSLYGYEYASRSLVESLFLSYATWNGVNGFYGASSVVSGISNLLNDFGRSFSGSFPTPRSLTTIDGYDVEFTGESFSYGLMGTSSECGINSCRAYSYMVESNGVAVAAYLASSYGWDSTSTTPLTLGVDSSSSRVGSYLVKPSVVPVPAAAWLFGSALLGFFGFSRRKANA